jgi:hypothetical protein
MRLGYCCAIAGVVKANRPTAAKAKATMRCSIESYKVLCFVEASLGRGNDRQQEVWLPAVKRSVFRRPENGGRRHIDQFRNVACYPVPRSFRRSLFLG